MRWTPCCGGATALSANRKACGRSAVNLKLVGSLKRQAVLSQLFPFLAPGFMKRALRVIRSRFRARKLNGIHAVKVAYLIALCLQPDIFYSGDFRRHSLDARQGLIFVILRSGVLPLVNHKVHNGLGLAKPVLRRDALPVPKI